MTIFRCSPSHQVRFQQQPSIAEQWRHLPDLSLRIGHAQSPADALLLLRKSQVRPSDLPAAMAHRVGNKCLRAVQVSVHHAHQDQTLQRGIYHCITCGEQVGTPSAKCPPNPTHPSQHPIKSGQYWKSPALAVITGDSFRIVQRTNRITIIIPPGHKSKGPTNDIIITAHTRLPIPFNPLECIQLSMMAIDTQQTPSSRFTFY